MTAVVFLGPSLPVEHARTLLDAVYLPPVRQGDVLSALGAWRPSVIGIVDGEFGQTLSVWHKEILYALHQGVHVFGASSMGALRAAETAAYGTVGVGEVFRMYADGVIADDDEVALAHATADAGYRPLSEAMVNVRATLARAVVEGVLEPATYDRLVARCKAMHFTDRSYAAVVRAAVDEGLDPAGVARLRAFVRANRVDLKRDDAIALLHTLGRLPTPLPPHVPSFEFEWTRNFETLYDHDRAVRHGAGTVSLSDVAAHVALHAEDFNALNARAMDRALVEVLADVLELDVPPAEVDAERRRFRVERRLTTDADEAAWRARNDLTAGEHEELVRTLARRRALHRWLVQRRGHPRTARLVLDELRLRDDYAAWVGRAAAQERLLAAPVPAGAADDGHELTDVQLAVEHMRATACRMPAAAAEWADEAGFGSLRQLRIALLRARAARRRARAAARAAGFVDVGGTP
ncbi:hypothetical protein tb265_49780 [Gemmatimonadetes bacterium T265]|nr:hypothetical protein tb265_49780 [Gemmatimonadetes bacterium T265]